MSNNDTENTALPLVESRDAFVDSLAAVALIGIVAVSMFYWLSGM